MKQEDWTKQLRDKLADHEMPAPADLWADIEARLQQEGIMQSSEQEATKRIHRGYHLQWLSDVAAGARRDGQKRDCSSLGGSCDFDEIGKSEVRFARDPF